MIRTIGLTARIIHINRDFTWEQVRIRISQSPASDLSQKTGHCHALRLSKTTS